MSQLDLPSLREALTSAGVEVYRSVDGEIQIAERVRLHMMDSGVRVTPHGSEVAVRFTVKSQKSDFPGDDAEAHFARVRAIAGAAASARGYDEVDARAEAQLDPVDDQKVLDVFHEVTFETRVSVEPDTARVVDEVRWALTVEKYVSS